MENNAPFFADPLDQNPATETIDERYNPLKDRVYITGLVLLAISLVLFIFFTNVEQSRDLDGFFTLHYLLVWVYTITLWANHRLRWWMFGARRADYPSMLLLLMIWLVSCFALNREMTIFRPSVSWLEVHLIISGLACVAFAWHERMSAVARWILWFALGSTAVLFTYYSIVLMPFAGMGLLIFWFFGLSFHALIPLALTVYLTLILRNAIRKETGMRMAVFSGLGIPLLIAAVFSGAWYRVSHELAEQERIFHANPPDLPKWVFISQHLERNQLNNYLLEAIAEGTLNIDNNGFFSGAWINTFGVSKNDPLMQVASLVSAKSTLSDDECRKIYSTQYDSRNIMEERLWSGDDLITTHVESLVQLDPGHRLSYTEKILTVAQKPIGKSSRTRTQEAIYTFFLPEGGVVTSLSLWINGKEEPGLLTATSKAKEAYTTIVGRERRDPAVVFWQEGNQVRVRVFPVTPDMPRQFKVGITAPLRYDDQALEYDNITFDGPPALAATEQDSVYFEGAGTYTDVPARFKHERASGTLTFDGLYRHQWSLRCSAPALVRNTFTFDGKSYSVSPWNRQSEPFRPGHIYVDLNAAWTQPELAKVRALLGSYAVSAATPAGDLERLTEENIARIFQQSRSLRFSLFPFYKIEDPGSSLVLTKSAAPTPLPSELEDSGLGQGLKQWNPSPVRVFHLGDSDNLTAYLRAFQEKRTLFCVSGNMDLLEKYLNGQTFPVNPETSQTVAIPASGILISETQGASNGKAPDHLFRLFAYNTVLKELGNTQGAEPENLVRLAEQAYVVTPVSSLVTLETQEDYDRFDIKHTPGLQSLGNAGAVPEPHEWALIVLLTLGALLAWRGKIW